MKPHSNRPLSPHIQIYDMTRFTSFTSLMHRATGIICALGMVFVASWLTIAASGEANYRWANKVLSHWFVVAGLFIWSGCLCYHFCNGIRHLRWDIGKGFGLVEAKRSAVIVQIATVLMNLTLWLAIWSVL